MNYDMRKADIRQNLEDAGCSAVWIEGFMKALEAGAIQECSKLLNGYRCALVWNREGLSPKLRSILTVTVLVSKGLVDNSLQNGVTKDEMAEILTHVAFYAGWPNAWAAFRAAVEVYREDPEGFTNEGWKPADGRQ